MFLMRMMCSNASFSSLSRWLLLFVGDLFVLMPASPTTAWLTALGSIYLVEDCFFFNAWYFLQKTTSGMIYSWFASSTLTIEKLEELFTILNRTGTRLFSWSFSVSESYIHLFISPAMTTNSHFFSKAFISRSSLKASILLSLLSSVTKPVFKNVLVSWSQVVRILDLSPPPVFLKVLVQMKDCSQLFLVSTLLYRFLREEFRFFMSKMDFWLMVESRLVFRLPFWFQIPKGTKLATVRVSLELMAFRLRIYSALNLYPIFFWTVSTKMRYYKVFLCSQMSQGSTA